MADNDQQMKNITHFIDMLGFTRDQIDYTQDFMRDIKIYFVFNICMKAKIEIEQSKKILGFVEQSIIFREKQRLISLALSLDMKITGLESQTSMETGRAQTESIFTVSDEHADSIIAARDKTFSDNLSAQEMVKEGCAVIILGAANHSIFQQNPSLQENTELLHLFSQATPPKLLTTELNVNDPLFLQQFTHIILHCLAPTPDGKEWKTHPKDNQVRYLTLGPKKESEAQQFHRLLEQQGVSATCSVTPKTGSHAVMVNLNKM